MKTETPGQKGKKGKPKTYVTEEQMRKMGFKNCNIDDLNRALETYGITTKKESDISLLNALLNQV